MNNFFQISISVCISSHDRIRRVYKRLILHVRCCDKILLDVLKFFIYIMKEKLKFYL